MDKIEELATIDARDDFIAFDEWLEKIKEKIADIEVTEDDLSLIGLAVFTGGLWLGSRVPTKLRWLVKMLASAGFTYSAGKLLTNLFKSIKEEETEKEELIEALNDYRVLGVPDELVEVVDIPDEMIVEDE